ncbi:RNA-dependent RNA polymerase [Hubei narna-like virus 4]|uniref:RNA-dependent RNA polymerase n=1 Tax=Hubei narna-like virus 4 TaxID=1922958 RepID=UPI00090A4AAA|nr:RNA-dependent RNA polymerase [Hubei narna-like virus 4]APG77249.1 RNA-dependent RNA polymerase [Hubei narna-like virus 4]
MFIFETFSGQCKEWQNLCHSRVKEALRIRKLPACWACHFPSDDNPEYLQVVTSLFNSKVEEKDWPKYIQWAIDFSTRLLESYLTYFELGLNRVLPTDRKILRKVIFDCLDYWFLLSLIGKLPKYLKYWTCKFFSDILQQFDQPEKPEIPLKFKPFICGQIAGKIHLITYVRTRSDRKPSEDHIKFFFGLLDLKKASRPIHKIFVTEEVEKSIERLTTSPEREPLRNGIIRSIKRVCNSLVFSHIRGNCSDIPINLPSCLPTTGGLENPRRTGGCYGFLQGNLSSLCNNISGSFHLCNMEKDGEILPVSVPFNPRIELSYYRHLDDLSKTYPGSIPVEMVGLPEPFKVRTISKGPIDLYAQARRYQGLFWHLLRHSPVFSLTWSPLCEYHLRYLYNGNPFSKNRLESYLLSADYEAATDSIYKEIIEETAEHLFHLLDIPWSDRALLLKILTRCEIERLDGESLKQKRGQLMGSPLSFVLLCIINAGVNLFVIEKSIGERIKFPLFGEEVPFLVNGDDYLSFLPVRYYEFWKECVTSVGLKPSLGKNYLHPYLGTVNSTLIKINRPLHFDERFKDNLPGKIFRHLKLSLAYPPEEQDVLIKDDTFDWRKISIKTNLERLILDQKEDIQRTLIFYALRKFKKFLSVIPKEIPYSVSPSLGGLGIPLVDHKQVSDPHRMRVSYLITRPPKRGRTLIFPGEVSQVDLLLKEKENQLLDQLEIPWEPGTEKPSPREGESPFSRWCFLYEFEKIKPKVSILQTLKKWSYIIKRELKESNRLLKVLRPASSTSCKQDVKPWTRTFPLYTFDLGLGKDDFVSRAALFREITPGIDLFI